MADATGKTTTLGASIRVIFFANAIGNEFTFIIYLYIEILKKITYTLPASTYQARNYNYCPASFERKCCQIYFWIVSMITKLIVR